MKQIIAIVTLMTLFIGCGSSEESSSSMNDSSVGIAKQGSIVRNQSPRSIFNNRSNNLKVHQKAEELTSGKFACAESGSLTREVISQNEYSEKLDKCVYPSEGKLIGENGTYVFSLKNNGVTVQKFLTHTYIPDYENNSKTGEYSEEFIVATVKIEGTDGFYANGDITFVENNEVDSDLNYKEFYYINNQDGSFFMKGSVTEKDKCSSKEYLYSMEDGELLVPYDLNSIYYKSGTITVNGLKYVFNERDVTLSKNGETETISQDEMIAAIEASAPSGCSISKAIKKSYE